MMGGKGEAGIVSIIQFKKSIMPQNITHQTIKNNTQTLKQYKTREHDTVQCITIIVKGVCIEIENRNGII